MSETQNSNQIISNNSENTKENKVELNETMPTEPTGLPNIETKYSRYLRKAIRKIEKRKPKDVGSIFDYSKKLNVTRRKKFGNETFITDFYNKKNNNEKNDYNVFSKEDTLVKDLMAQFRKNNFKDKIPKIRRKKIAFNKLYGITNESREKIKKIKLSKNKYSLEKYQAKMLKVIDTNIMEQTQIINLIQNFNDLKNESNNIKPLPPINIKTIRDHIIKNKKVENRKKTLNEIMNNTVENLDDFEKEEKMIKLIKAHKSQPKKNINKNFDILPEYIRNIFTKKLNYHN